MTSNLYSRVLLGTFIVIISVAIALGFLLPKEDHENQTGITRNNDTLGNCHPDPNATQSSCEARECIWQDVTDGSPPCTFPDVYGYIISDGPEETDLGWRATLQRIDRPSMFGDDLDIIVVDVEFYTETMVRIKFSDVEGTRFRVPEEAVNIPRPDAQPDEDRRLYDVFFENSPQFGVRVVRRSSGTVVFDTTVPGLTFSDQYLSITSRLSSAFMYGLGEHNQFQFAHDMNWTKWTIFARDAGVSEDQWNLYGHQTFYMNVEDTKHTNGVFLHNTNAMDVVLQPEPHAGISYHTIGGILDFYIFLGPSPENIVQQYTEALGRPLMPPYWWLGFQICRWGYKNLTHTRNVVERNVAAGIPYDVQYGEIDSMESYYDFTYDKDLWNGLPEFVDDIHNMGMKYVIILDHCIGSDLEIIERELNGTYLPYSQGIEMDIFIRDPRNPDEYLEGEVWPGKIYYPDFTKLENATAWWLDQCEDFYSSSRWRVEYDSLWVDMNEPSNFVPGSLTGCDDTSKYNSPPYLPNILGSLMYDKTICMEAQQNWGLQYDVHSLYGHSMAMVTYNTLRQQFPDKRPMVLTRSQYAGSQKYAAHWLGDNQSYWPHLGWSIIGMMEYSLFGFSFTGADICGFFDTAEEEMCIRWHQLGAFYPYSRNHNAADWPDQDPGSPLFTDELRSITREILLVRYKLLPYLYTLLHQAHISGSTVVRPLLHEFLNDEITWTLDDQFLWGAALLISPALEQGQTEVNVYLPDTRWYDYFTGAEEPNVGQFVPMYTPLDKINLHVRGGYILPWQYPAHNTYYSRQNGMGLIVALGDASTHEARGMLFWDDGDSYDTYGIGQYLQVDFHAAQMNEIYELEMSVVHSNYTEADSLSLNAVDIFGLSGFPFNVTVDGREWINYQFNQTTSVLTITDLDLRVTDSHNIAWTVV